MSHDLEAFITTLSTTQAASADKHRHLADYLFHGHGWSILKRIFTNQLQVSPVLSGHLKDSYPNGHF